MIHCTRRESDVLLLLTQGLSNKTIALRLGLSPHTVRDHVGSLMQRHGVANRVELAIHANAHPWQIGDDTRQFRPTRLAQQLQTPMLPTAGEASPPG